MSALDNHLKFRVSEEMRAALEQVVGTRPEGTKLSDIVREALREYLEHRVTERAPDKAPPPPAPKRPVLYRKPKPRRKK